MTATTPLVRKNVTSLYEQIAMQLREEALGGLYEPSGKLPSEAQLCERFAVSRITVRLALDRLTEEGVVERKQGKGTYVSGKQVRHNLDALRSFHDSLVMQGLKPEMRVLSKEVVPLPAHLRPLFGKKTSHCVLLERLHLADGEPIAIGISYLPKEVDELGREEIASRPNYALLKSLNGEGVARADVAIRAQLADRRLARLLKTKTGSAVLVMTRTSAFRNGECCDHSTFFIRPERYEFVASCRFQPA
jgi:GntR family transcriptional regulator